MTAQPFAVSPQDRTQSLSVVGEHITVLASAAQTPAPIADAWRTPM
jgi:hypothetical protein